MEIEYGMGHDVMVVGVPDRLAEIVAERQVSGGQGDQRRRMARPELVVSLFIAMVLGLIATFSFDGATSDAVVASCNANVRQVGYAVAALEARSNGAVPLTPAAWRAALLPGSAYPGAPYLRSWPRTPRYVIAVAGRGMAAGSGDGIVPTNGDVLVIVTATSQFFDASVQPGVGCARS